MLDLVLFCSASYLHEHIISSHWWEQATGRNGRVRARKTRHTLTGPWNKLGIEPEEHKGQKHVHFSPSQEPTRTVGLRASEWSPASAALQTFVLHETTGIKPVCVGPEDARVDMQLLVWHQELPAWLQGFATDFHRCSNQPNSYRSVGISKVDLLCIW